MTSANGNLTLKDFSRKIFDAIGMGNDALSSIELINKRAYNRIRKNINAAIGVGDIERFSGPIDEDTEIGDVTDIFIILLETTYPNINYATSTQIISLDEQRAFRDTLIKELDEMAGRWTTADL